MLKWPRASASLAAVLLLISCVHSGGAGPGPPAPSGGDTSAFLKVPGTYTTGQSCGEESGDEVFLTLLSSNLFILRQTYRDRTCDHHVTVLFLGRWSMPPDGRHLTLDAGPQWLRRLDIVDRHILRIVEPPQPVPPAPDVYQMRHPVRLLPFSDPFKLRWSWFPTL